MRIPFFGKKPKNTTMFGLVEGDVLSPNSFKTVEGNFKKYYNKHVEKNTKILNDKLEKAKLWTEFIVNATKDIPKEHIGEIKTVIDPNNDLESVAMPRVFIQVQYINKNDDKPARQYDVYIHEHTESERSMNTILEDIRFFKRELKKDSK